jgi:hypothetical protein
MHNSPDFAPTSAKFKQIYVDDRDKQTYMYLPNANNVLGWQMLPKKGSVWKHNVNDTLYVVRTVGKSNLEVDIERYNEFPIYITYRDTVTWHVWTRPLHLFLDRCSPHS